MNRFSTIICVSVYIIVSCITVILHLGLLFSFAQYSYDLLYINFLLFSFLD